MTDDNEVGSSGVSNDDIQALVAIRELLIDLDKHSVFRIVEFLKQWNTNRPAPGV